MKEKIRDYKKNSGEWIRTHKKTAIIAVSVLSVATIALTGLLIYKDYQDKYGYRKIKGYYSVTITPVAVVKDVSTNPSNLAFIEDENETLYAVYLPWEMEVSVNPDATGEDDMYTYTQKIGELAHNIGISTYMGYVEKICGEGSQISMTVFNGEKPVYYRYNNDEVENRYYVLDYPIYVNSVDSISYTLNGNLETESFEEYKKEHIY